MGGNHYRYFCRPESRYTPNLLSNKYNFDKCVDGICKHPHHRSTKTNAMQKFYVWVLLLFALPAAGWSQTKGTISGHVTADNNEPLSNANVQIQSANFKRGSVSDKKGAFQFVDVPFGKYTITVSSAGFESIDLIGQTVDITNPLNISVTLKAISKKLDDVVVTGYGTQRKKDVTGAVKNLRSDEFNKGIINSPQQLLQGKVAGVNVTSASGEPGGMMGITVRGPGGVRSGSTPLFVVDGFPLDNSGTGGGDPLNFLNPSDIETFDVLKDASATAIYGARGANGVILITTKKGKAGTSQLGLAASVGVSKIANALPVFTADQFRKEVVRIGGALDDKGGSTDWQDVITRSAITQNYNLTLSGGADKLTYYASFGAQKQEGILKNNNLDRYTGRFNATQKFLEDRLVIEANVTVSGTKNTRPPIGAMLGDAISNNPTYPAYDATGKPAVYLNVSNPLVYLGLDKDVATINRVLGNIS